MGLRPWGLITVPGTMPVPHLCRLSYRPDGPLCGCTKFHELGLKSATLLQSACLPFVIVRLWLVGSVVKSLVFDLLFSLVLKTCFLAKG